MAIVRAVKSGNWSDTTVWNTGALPTSADDVYSNTYTVTIDTSPTVLSIRATSATGVTAGGRFLFTNGITVTCAGAGFVGNNFNNGEIYFNLNSPAVVNLVGNIVGSGGLIIDGNGTVNVTGNVVNPNNNTPAIFFNSSIASGSTLNITGNVSGATSGSNAQPTIRLQAIAATVNVTGNVTASTNTANTAIGEITSGGAVISIVGTITATDFSPAIFVTTTSPNLYFSGPFICSPSGIHAVCAPKWRWTTATPTNSYYQIRNLANTAIRPLYTADSVGGNPATTNVRSGTIYGPNSELTGTCAVPAAGSVALGVPVDATTGTAVLTAANVRSAVGLASANLDTQLAPLPNLDTSVSSRLASSSYTAPLDASGTRSALGLSSANLDTQLAPLPNLDTSVSSRSTFNPAVDTVAQVTLVDTTTDLTNPPDVPTTAEIATAVVDELNPTLSEIDDNVLSRLAAVDYTTPPTAQENAQAVETQLSLPLGNLDAAVSSRSTFNPAADTVANVTLVETTVNLTNPPVVPTPEQIAEAVREELSPELERIENCATVATTGQQIQNALSS